MLSAKSAAVLTAIGGGYTYEQIVAAHPGFTYLDIFAAAREALAILQEAPPRTMVEETSRTPTTPFSDIRKEHQRAYEKWTEEEENRLLALAEAGCPISFIAKSLERQPSAIRSRLDRLGVSRQ